MKRLKNILVLTYIVIIILLLLGLVKCNCDNKVRIDRKDRNTSIIKEKFRAEVVMCIDCTGSMESIINTIKSNALNFYPDLKDKCILQGKEITSMRIMVIGFRDFGETKPIEKSAFFDMPDQEAGFREFVSELQAIGGGDSPEIGYTALQLAMQSGFCGDSDVHQIIILWTDSSSHPLYSHASHAQSFSELTAMWNTQMSENGKRLILFAPSDFTWTSLEREWDNVSRRDVTMGAGLTDVDYDSILRTLSESI